MAVGALIPHHSYRTDRYQDCKCLPQRARQPCPLDLFDHDVVRCPHQLETLAGHFADHADGKSRPGKRLAPHDLFRQSELLANTTDLIFEEVAKWLDQDEGHVLGEAPDVVVALDAGGDSRARFTDVGIQSALNEKRSVLQLVPRDFLEDANEYAADGLSLDLRIGDTGQLIEKAVGRFDVDEIRL